MTRPDQAAPVTAEARATDVGVRYLQREISRHVQSRSGTKVGSERWQWSIMLQAYYQELLIEAYEDRM